MAADDSLGDGVIATVTFIDNLFARAKDTDKAEDLKAITEAIDAAYKIRPAEKSGSDFSWVLSLLMLANGYGIFGTK